MNNELKDFINNYNLLIELKYFNIKFLKKVNKEKLKKIVILIE